eukprot:scaffold19400_cov108-Cylindrotheca_fusiformis.AAC.1
MVATWFERVNRDYLPFAVHLTDAVPLWHALPSPRHPRGQEVRQLDAVSPFRYQFERFLWAIHCDRVQRSIGLCTTRAEKTAFSWYLHHGAKLYPHGLCDSQAPATHQAFFGFLFHPNHSGWPDSNRNLLQSFDSLDREKELPDELHEFSPTSVPTTQDDSFRPARLAFAADQSQQVPLPVVHTQTAAPSPAPGPEATAPTNSVPFVTPAGGGNGGPAGNTNPVSQQQGSPAIFSISDTSVQPLPALPPPAMGQHFPPAVGPHQQHPVTPAPQPVRPQHPDPFLQPPSQGLQGQGGTQGVGTGMAISTSQVQQPSQSSWPMSTGPTAQRPSVPQPASTSLPQQHQQQQNSVPWWAPPSALGQQQSGPHSSSSHHPMRPTIQPAAPVTHHAAPQALPQFQQPPVSAPAQIFSPSSSGIQDVSDSARSGSLLQSAGPKRNLFGIPQDASSGTFGPLSGATSFKGLQYLSMMDAGISSAALRASSPPTFLALCFLLGHHRELPSGTQVHRISDGAAVPVDSFILLRQPCLVARPVLRDMEPKNKDVCIPMMHYLHWRIRSDPVIGRMGVPVQFDFCTKDFVAHAFSVSRWLSITHQPAAHLTGGSDMEFKPQFHPLFFQRALDASLPLHKVPATGYSRQAAVVLGSLILFFYQFLDVKVDHTGHKPDPTSFDRSCFGSLLSRWARIPASPIVDAVWSAHPLRCSAYWIAHLLELFKVFHDHHSQRVMLLGETNPAVGIEEVLITPPGETLVVGTNFLPTQETAFRSHSTIQMALANLEQRMRQLWEDQVALGPQASIWSEAFPSHLCVSSVESNTPSSGANGSSSLAGRSGQARSGGEASDSQRKRSRPAATPFVPQKPLMAFAASASSAPRESPFSILRNRNERDWPRLKDPQGKQHEPCQLCFACCFPPPYNRCGDPERCHVLRKP